MNAFFDSSALVKRYIIEDGSERVNAIFLEAKIIFVSLVCMPEIFSALNRLKREKKINQDHYRQIKLTVYEDFKLFNICALGGRVLREAIEILENYPSKTLDAIQLASALTVAADFFVCSDKPLLSIAQKIKINIIDVS